MAKKNVTAKQLKNKGNPNVTVQGRKYEISLNMGVLGELEEIYGNIDKAMKELQAKKIKAYINFMYAIMVLEEGNEDLTPKKVGKMLDTNFINDLIEKTGTAMLNSFGEAEEDENEELGEK